MTRAHDEDGKVATGPPLPAAPGLDVVVSEAAITLAVLARGDGGELRIRVVSQVPAVVDALERAQEARA